MPARQILPDIYSVGVVDWNIRSFHGHTYSTARGTSYNAYLIIDDKITLVDTVMGSFGEELVRNISHVVPVEKIDYVIANHVETDHSGALPLILKLAPKAKVFGTAKCKDGLYKNYYGDWDFQVVRTGDKLKLGKRTLSFIEAPMIHWPDSMFTYCPEEALLMPNDAFGQHYASSNIFDDEVDQCALMDEAAKYYANILWPLGGVIAKKIEEIQSMGIPLKVIAPSHGIIWRRDPTKIINAYIGWASNNTLSKAVVVYETMWQATARMAREITRGLIEAGVAVQVFDVALSDRTEIIKEMLDARVFILGSSTHDNSMLPTMAAFMGFLKGLKPKNRIAGVFGSYGWGGGAVQEIEKLLKDAGIELVLPGVAVKYFPDAQELKRCVDFAGEFARMLK